MYLIDTNIAVYLRDGDRAITARLARLPNRPAFSLLTWVELEGGVYRDPLFAPIQRAAVDVLIAMSDILPCDAAVVGAYARIVAARGFSRPRIIDRLIAATAIVHDLTLVTINAADFRDIPGLRLEAWPGPDQ